MEVIEKKQIETKERSSSRNIVEIGALVSFAISVIVLIINVFFDIEILYFVGLLFFCIAYQLGVRVFVGNVVPKFKNKINVNSAWFKSKSFEEKLYKKLNVKKWKNKAPIYEPEEFDFEKNTKEQLIINMCNAELVHEINALSGYLSIIIGFFTGYLPLYIIMSIGAGLIDIVFVVIQRYNRPRAVRLLNRMKK